jgi:hypothetical protein
MDPFRERYLGVTAYRFYFGKILGYIKVDRQAVPEVFREMILAPGRDLILVGRDFQNSNDLKAMRAVVHAAMRRKYKIF